MRKKFDTGKKHRYKDSMNGGEWFPAKTRKGERAMTKSELFKAAHKAAREYRNFFSCYAMAFSFALKEIYAMTKENGKTVTEKLEALGIDAWGCGDMKRYYINSDKLEAVFGLEIGYYKSGNISSARLNGEGISNSKAAKLIGQKIYFDAVSGEWMQKTWAGVGALNETLKSSIRI